MSLPISLKVRLIEILVRLPPHERKIVIEELKEVVQIICTQDGFYLADPSNAPYRSDSQGGLIYWN